jgi:hypothetical protein
MMDANQTQAVLSLEPPEADGVEDVPLTGIAEELADLDLSDIELRDILGYEEVPILLVDTDPERAVARQKEMMDTVFDGIGEEKKEEKRVGLALQQLDIEQRHALRLLLIYENADDLTAHLKRCLDEPGYGYGKRGDNGRTIAQAMAAVGDLEEIAPLWLETHREFQQLVLQGQPFSFRSLFDFADVTGFVPVVARVGDRAWRLGVEEEGKHLVFEGSIAEVWPRICDTFVEWCDGDNRAWLDNLKRQAERLPDSVIRTAQAERLRKERCTIEVDGNQVILKVERDGQDWPRSITLGDQIGLSRLSGHSFYELAWEGGLHARRFEISGTSKNKVPIEHIEMALRLAEALGQEQGLKPAPVSANDVEAAYLRRLKVKRAEVSRSGEIQLPRCVEGRLVAVYQARDIVAALLHGGNDFAYVTYSGENVTPDQGVLLRCNPMRGVMVALPVTRGRVMQGSALMSTPLADLDLKSGDWLRALSAWGAWLTKVTVQKQKG